MVASASAIAHNGQQGDPQGRHGEEGADEQESSASEGAVDHGEVHPPPGPAGDDDSGGRGDLLATSVSVATSGSVRHSRTTSFADFLPGGPPGGGASMSNYVSMGNLDATPEGRHSADAMFGAWAGEHRRSQWKALQWAVQVGRGN